MIMKMNTLQNTILVLLGCAALASCSQQNIVTPVDFSVSLDGDNVYRPGQPVHFKFSGDADYMVFYSGEKGHEFRYRDRTSVPMEDVTNITLNMEYTMNWGWSGKRSCLDLYVSKTFPGLLGTEGDLEANGKADRETVKKMTATMTADGEMEGWQKLEFDDIHAIHQKLYQYSYDITDYKDDFCLAIHWHPNTMNFTRNQATYYINGSIEMTHSGGEKVVTDLSDIELNHIVMNEQDPPYLGKNPLRRGDTTAVATCHFDNSRYAIFCEGTNPHFLPYEIDVWIISRIMPLNSVIKDSGKHIKNMMNPIYDYEYTYSEPGTYKAVFHGVNDNYQGHSESVKEVTVIVADDPVFKE